MDSQFDLDDVSYEHLTKVLAAKLVKDGHEGIYHKSTIEDALTFQVHEVTIQADVSLMEGGEN